MMLLHHPHFIIDIPLYEVALAHLYRRIEDLRILRLGLLTAGHCAFCPVQNTGRHMEQSSSGYMLRLLVKCRHRYLDINWVKAHPVVALIQRHWPLV